jgi:hypothetical protein
MRAKSIKINCSLFAKLFLVKEAKLLDQEANLHINVVIDQRLQQSQAKKQQRGLIDFFISPILNDRKNDLAFIPVRPLEKKLARYSEHKRAILLEDALTQHVISLLHNKIDNDLHVQIATETLEELSCWENQTPKGEHHA